MFGGKQQKKLECSLDICARARKKMGIFLQTVERHRVSSHPNVPVLAEWKSPQLLSRQTFATLKAPIVPVFESHLVAPSNVQGAQLISTHIGNVVLRTEILHTCPDYILKP